MKDEQEFDQKIRESALTQESLFDKPLWNKVEVWNRVEEELERKNRFIWGKVAAVIIILIISGWLFELRHNITQYKQIKETEICNLQNKLDQIIETQNNVLLDQEMIVQRQTNELDSLKNQLICIKKIFQNEEIIDPVIVINEITDPSLKPNKQDSLINSLQEELRLVQEKLATIEQVRYAEETKRADLTEASKAVSSEKLIYYSNTTIHERPNKKGLTNSFMMLRLFEKENSEYSLDHTIF